MQNSLREDPLTRTDTLAVERMAMIHFLQVSLNPICLMTWSRKLQFTELKAFSKSALKNVLVQKNARQLRKIEDIGSGTGSRTATTG
ncbi:hypothetical protein LXL04_016715 [Taraxacum kok-saghyz]